jgi:hypothetical protein
VRTHSFRPSNSSSASNPSPRPGWVPSHCCGRRGAWYTPAWRRESHLQAIQAVQPMHALDVHVPALTLQQHRYPPVAVAHVRFGALGSAGSVVICRATCRNGATGLAERQGKRTTHKVDHLASSSRCHSLRRLPGGHSRPNGRRLEMKRRSRACSRQLVTGAPGRSFLSASGTDGRSGDRWRRPPPPLRRSANSHGALSGAATALCLAPSINGMDEFANTIAPGTVVEKVHNRVILGLQRVGLRGNALQWCGSILRRTKAG